MSLWKYWYLLHEIIMLLSNYTAMFRWSIFVRVKTNLTQTRLVNYYSILFDTVFVIHALISFTTATGESLTDWETLATFEKFQIPVLSLAVYQYAYNNTPVKIWAQLVEIKLWDNNGRKNTLVIQGCVIEIKFK